MVKYGSHHDVFAASFPSSPLWRYFQGRVFGLTIPRRDIHDPIYSLMTRATGDDLLPRDDDDVIHLPHLRGTTDVHEGIDFVFPDEVLQDPDACSKRAILSGTNDMVDSINQLIFERLPGQARTYYSTDRNAAADAQHVYNPLASMDLLNARNFPGMPPHELRLKVGAVCFLERNLSIDDQLMHNSKVVVTLLHDR